MRVRTHNDITQWLKFFLTGVIETAQKGVETLDATMQLKKSIEEQLDTLGKRSADARVLVNYLYKRPAFSASDAIVVLDRSPQTVYNLIGDLEKLNIVSEITGAQRNKIYLFEPYLKLF